MVIFTISKNDLDKLYTVNNEVSRMEGTNIPKAYGKVEGSSLRIVYLTSSACCDCICNCDASANTDADAGSIFMFDIYKFTYVAERLLKSDEAVTIKIDTNTYEMYYQTKSGKEIVQKAFGAYNNDQANNIFSFIETYMKDIPATDIAEIYLTETLQNFEESVKLAVSFNPKNYQSNAATLTKTEAMFADAMYVNKAVGTFTDSDTPIILQYEVSKALFKFDAKADDGICKAIRKGKNTCFYYESKNNGVKVLFTGILTKSPVPSAEQIDANRPNTTDSITLEFEKKALIDAFSTFEGMFETVGKLSLFNMEFNVREADKVRLHYHDDVTSASEQVAVKLVEAGPDFDGYVSVLMSALVMKSLMSIDASSPTIQLVLNNREKDEPNSIYMELNQKCATSYFVKL